MNITKLTRVFRYHGKDFADPGADFTPAQVKDLFANAHPELLNADVTGPTEEGDKLVYTFQRATGTKGRSSAKAKGSKPPFAARLAQIAKGGADPMAPADLVPIDAEAQQCFLRIASRLTGRHLDKSQPQHLPITSACLPL